MSSEAVLSQDVQAGIGAAVAATSAPGLASFALAVIAAQMDGDLLAREGSTELVYLREQLRQVGPDRLSHEHLQACLEHPEPSDRALVELSTRLELSALELLSVALALAVEEDVMVGRVLAHLQRPLGGSRPSLGLLATSLQALCDHPYPIHHLLSGRAMAVGLLERQNETAPLPEQSLSLPSHLVLALRGYDGAVVGATIDLREGLTVPLPRSFHLAVQEQARGLRGQRVLVVRSGCLDEARAVAAALASALNCRPLFLSGEGPKGLGSWLLLRGLLPVFCLDLAPGERQPLRRIAGYEGPVVALCGPDGSVDVQDRTALSWSLPVPPEEEREQLWGAALGVDGEAGWVARDLASSHRHGCGRIAQLGQLIRHQQALMAHATPSQVDVLAAARGGEGGGLASLAKLLPEAVCDDALVVPSPLEHDLEELLRRCRNRDRLVEHLGPSARARYHAGVKALFVGPSGTGKTLAASWLATRLGMPLYRVDLASITSKYIGETEKNLSELLAKAEQAEVVLLFDEADSLFGQRTDIKESNDRFANAQTNYLLQRIESYDGIVLLTSNSRQRFDAAFSRRIDTIIDFPLPGPSERHSLWLSHLGEHHNLNKQDVDQLAALAEVGGGTIRNVVLAAAVPAREETRKARDKEKEPRKINALDIRMALAAEYRKLGQQMPAALSTSG